MASSKSKVSAREQALESACDSALEELRKWRDFAPEDQDLPGIIKELNAAIRMPKTVPAK